MQQDVSLYIQTFQVLHPKTLLPFLQKGKKLRNLFFVFLEIRFKIPNSSNLFFFNLPRFQNHPDSSYLAQPRLTLLFSKF